ncbi:MAG: hypothetical protein WBF33_39340 [Candidatus Nitrosopolaris sp.]
MKKRTIKHLTVNHDKQFVNVVINALESQSKKHPSKQVITLYCHFEYCGSAMHMPLLGSRGPGPPMACLR